MKERNQKCQSPYNFRFFIRVVHSLRPASRQLQMCSMIVSPLIYSTWQIQLKPFIFYSRRWVLGFDLVDYAWWLLEVSNGVVWVVETRCGLNREMVKGNWNVLLSLFSCLVLNILKNRVDNLLEKILILLLKL